MAYDYFEKGGAYFRRRDEADAWVDDVWRGPAMGWVLYRWVPYRRHQLTSVFLGSRIPASELPPGAADAD